MDLQLEYKTMPLALADGTFENIRLYDGVPSVTTVLKILRDDESLEKYKKVNMEAFNTMLKAKGKLGEKLHNTIEKTFATGKFHYLNTPHNKARLKFRTSRGCRWQMIKQEEVLRNDSVGGRYDWVGYIKGKRYLVDWKTMGTKVYDTLLLKYMMQSSKYIDMYEEKYGIELTGGKIVAMNTRGTYKIYTIPDKKTLKEMYDKVLVKRNEMYALYIEMHEGKSLVN